MLPHPPHPRKVVFELRELDLKLALGCDRMLREDVEDELGAIDDAELELVLETPLLPRIEVVVDDQRFRFRHKDGRFQLGELSLAHVGARLRCRTALHELADGLDAGGAQKLAHLRQLLFLVHSLAQHRDEKAALGLSPGRGVRLVVTHGLIMPSSGREAKTRCGARLPRGARPRR